ncbi:agmatinase [Candidatus Woesearchaeota archaeon CG10_big_fil_rev_8_21_14_0_10_36_11]|nr:MAG: agmatinase [Candidatus Woesearchaeota archaeon CG10_big_fil_rev_8_21_14_0_10_36_11]
MERWMNLPQEYSKGMFVIIPIEYEKDVTYGKGTSKGSSAIIDASKHLEYYDEQFDIEPFEKGIELVEPLQLQDVSPEEMIKTVSDTIQQQKNKFIIGLGGDHAVTIGMVQGMEQLHDDFSVIILDAHADFRDSWNNSQYNHACVAKQISKNHTLLSIGVRSMDIDEKKSIDMNDNVHLIKSYDFTLERLQQILPKLKQKVYLSIDVDVFDPSFIRNTGTPEPNGLQLNTIITILKTVFEQKKVIGGDVVEFAPNVNYDAEAYSLAKLVYKIMALYSKFNH